MKKWTRARKLTMKVIVVYAVGLVLLAFAEPDPSGAWFWAGLSATAAGQGLRIWAAGHLRKNQRLTTTGPYAHVKNPLYVGTFFILLGFCAMAQGGGQAHWALNHLNWIVLGVCVLAFVAYYAPYKKKREGARLERNFGEEWRRYDRSVPDYFPRPKPYVHPGAEAVRWSFRTVRENSEHWTPLLLAAGVAALLHHREILSFIERHFG